MLGKTTHFACSPLGCCTLLSISLCSLSPCRSSSLKKRLTHPLPYWSVVTLNILYHELLMCVLLYKLCKYVHKKSNSIRSPPASLSSHTKSVPSNFSAHKASYTKVYLLTCSFSELTVTMFVNNALKGFCHRSDCYEEHTRHTTTRRPTLQKLQLPDLADLQD